MNWKKIFSDALEKTGLFKGMMGKLEWWITGRVSAVFLHLSLQIHILNCFISIWTLSKLLLSAFWISLANGQSSKVENDDKVVNKNYTRKKTSYIPNWGRWTRNCPVKLSTEISSFSDGMHGCKKESCSTGGEPDRLQSPTWANWSFCFIWFKTCFVRSWVVWINNFFDWQMIRLFQNDEVNFFDNSKYLGLHECLPWLLDSQNQLPSLAFLEHE